MGLLNKLFAKDKDRTEATMDVPAPECPHTALVPRWDSVDDIGHNERATYYVCEACEQKFSPQEAHALLDSIADRLAGSTVG